MKLGEELHLRAETAREQMDSNEQCDTEWAALVDVLRGAANQGMRGIILPSEPTAVYPALAGNIGWLRRKCRSSGIEWESRTELGTDTTVWAFFWPEAQETPEAEETDGNGKTRLRIGQVHLAYVRTDLLTRFRHERGLVNLTPWLRETIWNNFHIEITDNDSMKQLQKALDRRFFDSCGEWLQTIMRANLKFQNLWDANCMYEVSHNPDSGQGGKMT